MLSRVSSWTLNLSSGGEFKPCSAILLTMDAISCWNEFTPSGVTDGAGAKTEERAFRVVNLTTIEEMPE